ncbi:uncharacterized protein LOC144752810 [Lissotriton helveticus]
MAAALVNASGDGRVDFEDFVSVVTDNRIFAWSLGKNQQPGSDIEALDTVLIEAVTKLVDLAALPDTTTAEIVSYYKTKYKHIIGWPNKIKPMRTRRASMSAVNDEQYLNTIGNHNAALGRKGSYATPFCPKRDCSLKAKTPSLTARKQSLFSSVDWESHNRENTMRQVNLAQLRGTYRMRHNTVQIKLDIPAWKLHNLTMNDLQHLRRKVKKGKKQFYDKQSLDKQGSMVQLWERLGGERLAQDPMNLSFSRLFRTYSWSWSVCQDLVKDKILLNRVADSVCSPRSYPGDLLKGAVQQPLSDVEQACDYHWEQDTHKDMEESRTKEKNTREYDEEWGYLIHGHEVGWERIMQEIREELEESARKFRVQWSRKLKDIHKERERDLHDIKEELEHCTPEISKEQEHKDEKEHSSHECKVDLQSIPEEDKKEQESSTCDYSDEWEHSSQNDIDDDWDSIHTDEDEPELIAIDYKDDWEPYSPDNWENCTQGAGSGGEGALGTGNNKEAMHHSTSSLGNNMETRGHDTHGAENNTNAWMGNIHCKGNYKETWGHKTHGAGNNKGVLGHDTFDGRKTSEHSTHQGKEHATLRTRHVEKHGAYGNKDTCESVMLKHVEVKANWAPRELPITP